MEARRPGAVDASERPQEGNPVRVLDGFAAYRMMQRRIADAREHFDELAKLRRQLREHALEAARLGEVRGASIRRRAHLHVVVDADERTLALFDSRKKRINRSRIASFVVGLTLLLTSCGGGGQSNSVTPVSRKNYSITINGVSGNIQASTTATIIIE